MRLMVLMAMLASLTTGHPDTPASAASTRTQAYVAQAPAIRLLIRGGTSQWAFQFVCAGAHCRFRHTHVLHRFGQAEYVNLAVRFSGVRDHQGDAALWLRRVSAKKESAEGN